MQAYPHHYEVHGAAEAQSDVTLDSEGLPTLSSAPPAQFGGPGNRWSPETLFVASVADCFILTFRAIATASKFAWHRLECRTEGVLDRLDGRPQFIELHLHARLTMAADGNADRAERLLEKAEQTCLVTNSLKVEPKLTTEISRA